MDFPHGLRYNDFKLDECPSAVGQHRQERQVKEVAEFQELIKNFDRIRDYMRQFYVYGYKSRSDYDGKSARTYDNERRRIESWLSGYVQSGYTEKGKNLYISVDSTAIPQNPLYAAWKSKSFTDNDIILHFFLLDLLWDLPDGAAASELTDRIAEQHGVVFDSQIVRLKLKEYEALGILCAKKEGKTLRYSLIPGPRRQSAMTEDTWNALLTAVSFFQEAAPFGFVGSTILDQADEKNRWFQFKHHFIVHTLEDEILLDLLRAIHEKRRVSLENKSTRSGITSTITGIPLKIFVSTQTGRRYVCLYQQGPRRFTNFRLDSITKLKLLDVCENYEELSQALERNQDHCYGVTFGGYSRMEEIYMKLHIDEEKEPHILDRLYREGRGGEILRIRENEYLYSGMFFDTNAALSWIKTFTGRILDIQGTSTYAISKLVRDLEKMYQMYGKEEPADESLS